jgi:3-oxoacyl-[acyl-carrier-protein] synthase-1
MRAGEEFSPGRPLVSGTVRGNLTALPSEEARWGGRNNQLLWSALQQIRPALDAAIRRYGPTRIAVVLGTSTSSIGAAESAFASRNPDASFPDSFHYSQMEIGTPSQFLAHFLGLQGPQLTISTACSSSAKALAAARRYLKLGLCDAVLCGGADMLCRFTVAGFSALEAVSPELCLPFSAKRKGINLGEAAALFLMEREGNGVELSGCGESCDAHHISAPEPEGRGAAEAMRAALEDASLDPDAIDYLNLHGTATLHNDAMESLAVARVLGSRIPCSSTKALSGHTLGAAGALEAAFCWLLLKQKSPSLPPHVYDGDYDPKLPPLRLARKGEALVRPLRYLMSNSFGFGGSNASLILGAL